MKITIFALHLGFGGVERYVATLANILSESHQVEIIATYKIVDSPAFSVNNSIKITYLIKNRLPNKEKLKEALKSKNIIKVIKECVYALITLILKKKRNIMAAKRCSSDIIITTRSFHNSIIGKYSSNNIIKIATEHNHHSNNQKYINEVINSCKKIDYLLPISKELTSFYKNQLKTTHTQVTYIPFCIEEPYYKKTKITSSPTFINVGRLSPEKGHEDLIIIFKELLSIYPDATLHIIGDGSLKDIIKKQILMEQLTKHVIMHGFLKKQEIDLLYCKSTLFLMTSHTESFGLVLLESMACGVPCIAFNSAQGANEIIAQDYNGYLIPNRDKTLFISSVCKTLSNIDKLQELSNNSFTTIETYAYRNTKKLWLEFIDSIH